MFRPRIHLFILITCSFVALLPKLVVGQEESAEISVDSLFRQAENLKWAGKYDSALTILDVALTKALETDNDSLEATVITTKGVIGMYQGRNSVALEHFFKGLKIREHLNDSAAMADSYNLIAAVHQTQQNYRTAAEYYQKCLALREVLRNEKQLGVLYNNIGSLHEDQGNYGEALWNHERSRAIWESMADTAWLSVSMRHIGVCYFNQGELQQALEYFLKSYEFNTKNKGNRHLADITYTIGTLYLEFGENEKAKTWCLRAKNLAHSQNYLHGFQLSCECLSDVFEEIGDHERALEHYRSSIETRDSIYGHERTKELTQLEMSFNFEKEQLADSLQFVQENELQEGRILRQRIGLMSTGAVTLMILVLAFVIYRGKRRSDHLLLNILPSEVAEELKEKGAAKAQKLENVTVLFTDFKGFTEISAKLSPEEMVAEIHECFSAFDSIMEKFGIEKIKTIGDAYMAAGGVPSPKESHAIDVVGAALEIQQFMMRTAEEKKKNGQLFFEVRIGVNTGPVVAGIVGTKKFQYDIWGDTVNTASRMESSGKVGKVNISESTYLLVKDEFDCEYRGEVEAKGKGKVKMYFAESKA